MLQITSRFVLVKKIFGVRCTLKNQEGGGDSIVFRYWFVTDSSLPVWARASSSLFRLRHWRTTEYLCVSLCRLNQPFLSSIRLSVEMLFISWFPPKFPCDVIGFCLFWSTFGGSYQAFKCNSLCFNFVCLLCFNCARCMMKFVGFNHTAALLAFVVKVCW